MKISERLKSSIREGTPTISFEYFPPKTAQGLQNLYDRIERMAILGPQFIDVTWNAGGRVGTLSCEIVNYVQSEIGVESCLHLTCLGMSREKIDDALKRAYNAGCQNILALRGDKPREETPHGIGEPVFSHAVDLIQYIREKYGDYFDIGVAGYPEGHPEAPDIETDVLYLKQKIDAGATFVITQMFYDVDNFLEWVVLCRALGVGVPIIPGIMPITSWTTLLRRTRLMQTQIPPNFLRVLEPIKDDDAAVREVGTKLVAGMCRKILESGILQLHFYTMNLEKATFMILEKLEITTAMNLKNPLPWRQCLAYGRKEENVRPIFWKNRNKSYVARTQEWDEFPNGRWGDARSPAYGELDLYGIGLKCTTDEAREWWGFPTSITDVRNLFADYILGNIKYLPWSDSPISPEIASIRDNLVDLNRQGFLTINSQPAVNGDKSSHPVYGWGPKNGYVYQKAYLECFCPPDALDQLLGIIEEDHNVTFHAVNRHGDLRTNTYSDGPNAVTWGVYPGKEIIQPTIVETVSFLAWKDEAYRLGYDWAKCYDQNSPTRKLIETVMDTYYLVNVVYNDFHQPLAIFDIFNHVDLYPATSLCVPNGKAN